MADEKKKRILVINPNTSTDMTARMMKVGGSDVDFYTAKKGPASINNDTDTLESARYVIEDLISSQLLSKYDAFLVSCYSVHPLVGRLQDELREAGLRAHVTGIFEASIVTALTLLPSNGPNFGIVSTGKYWEEVLTNGVNKFLGTNQGGSNPRFGGVATTGMDAGETQAAQPGSRMKDAVKSLCERNDIAVIILGCVAMSGMESVVREALVEKFGQNKAQEIIILDGVRCGIGMLENLVKNVPLRE